MAEVGQYDLEQFISHVSDEFVRGHEVGVEVGDEGDGVGGIPVVLPNILPDEAILALLQVVTWVYEPLRIIMILCNKNTIIDHF